MFQGFAGGHFLAVDLTTAPPSFNISTLDYQYTSDVSSRATADSCGLCGMCPPGDSCPLNTTAFPENPPDFCDTQTAAIFDISGEGPTDGLGPFTWSISVVRNCLVKQPYKLVMKQACQQHSTILHIEVMMLATCSRYIASTFLRDILFTITLTTQYLQVKQ